MTVTTAEPWTKRWTREEFYLLAEQGHFRGKRVQLIDGEIIEMAPQGHPHSTTISYLTHWAVSVFGADHLVRVQMPLNANANSDPEPDVAVIPRQKYTDHPETARLIIEVSDSSLLLDRRKAKLYAASGVEVYWIVNLADGQVEVHRHPVVAEERYEEITLFKRGQNVTPLARPAAQLSVTELLEW
ncbi:MAG: Uma2 family endonuclease [Tepidisphaeraceae bacterium]